MNQLQNEQPPSDSESDELNEDDLININRHLTRKTKGATRMTQEMDGIYKSALMNVIFGQFEEGSQKLMHLITLYPDNPEPYYLIATMYEQTGDLKKAIQYLLINTYLSPPNLQKWIKVADKSMELKMYDQAAYCYGRGLKIANYNIELALKRAQAFQLGNNDKKAITMYKRILKFNRCLTAIKKYAKLKFKKGEYSKARQILMEYPEYDKDKNILYMISETLLKQNKYKELQSLIIDKICENQLNFQTVPLEFLRMLYLSISANQGSQQTISQLETIIYQTYDEEDAQQYQELVAHMTNINETKAYTLAKFLLQFQKHKTLNNYLLVSQYLIKDKDFQKAQQIINEGIQSLGECPQMQSQLNYLDIVSGKTQEKLTKKATVKKKIIKQIPINDDEDQIYYSQEDSDQDFKQTIKPTADKKIKKQKKIIDPIDKNVISKLLNNSNKTLNKILSIIKQEEIETSPMNYFKQVSQIIDLLIGMSFESDKQTHNINEDGLLSQSSNRRKNAYTSKLNLRNTRTLNFLIQNKIIIKQIIEQLAMYLLILLRKSHFHKVIFLIEQLLKASFLKKNHKAIEFQQIKVQIFEMAVLACLNSKRFNRALFFMRFLLTKHPSNKFYVILLGYLSKNSSKKNCLGPMFRKFVLRDPKKGDQLLNFLLAMEYIETSEYEAAINVFMRIYSTIEESYKQKIHLYCAVSFLQLASSRNTFNKFDFVNRSAFCLKKYIEKQEEKPEVIFNIGRWFSQLKLYERAIYYFQQVLKSSGEIYLKKKAAYALMCIYKEIELFQKLQNLRIQFFSLPE